MSKVSEASKRAAAAELFAAEEGVASELGSEVGAIAAIFKALEERESVAGAGESIEEGNRRRAAYVNKVAASRGLSFRAFVKDQYEQLFKIKEDCFAETGAFKPEMVEFRRIRAGGGTENYNALSSKGVEVFKSGSCEEGFILKFTAAAEKLSDRLVVGAEQLGLLSNSDFSARFSNLIMLIGCPNIYIFDSEASIVKMIQREGCSGLLYSTIINSTTKGQGLSDLGVVKENLKQIITQGISYTASQLFFSLSMAYYLEDVLPSSVLTDAFLDDLRRMVPTRSAQMHIINEFQALLKRPEVDRTAMHRFGTYIHELYRTFSDSSAATFATECDGQKKFEDGLPFASSLIEKEIWSLVKESGEVVRALIPKSIQILIYDKRLAVTMNSTDIASVLDIMTELGIAPRFSSKFNGKYYLAAIYELYSKTEDTSLKERLKGHIERMILEEDLLDALLSTLIEIDSDIQPKLRKDDHFATILHQHIRALLSTYRSVYAPKDIKGLVQRLQEGVELIFHPEGRELTTENQTRLLTVLAQYKWVSLMQFALHNCYLETVHKVSVSRVDTSSVLMARFNPYGCFLKDLKQMAYEESDVASEVNEATRAMVKLVMGMGVSPLDAVDQVLETIFASQDRELICYALELVARQSSILADKVESGQKLKEIETGVRSLITELHSEGMLERFVKFSPPRELLNSVEKLSYCLSVLKGLDAACKSSADMTRASELMTRRSIITSEIVALIGFGAGISTKIAESLARFRDQAFACEIIKTLSAGRRLAYRFDTKDTEDTEGFTKSTIVEIDPDEADTGVIIKKVTEHIKAGHDARAIYRIGIAAAWQLTLNNWLGVMVASHNLSCSLLLIRLGAELGKVSLEQLRSGILASDVTSHIKINNRVTLFHAALDLCISPQEMQALSEKLQEMLQQLITPSVDPIRPGAPVMVIGGGFRAAVLAGIEQKIFDSTFEAVSSPTPPRQRKRGGKAAAGKGNKEAVSVAASAPTVVESKASDVVKAAAVAVAASSVAVAAHPTISAVPVIKPPVVEEDLTGFQSVDHRRKSGGRALHDGDVEFSPPGKARRVMQKAQRPAASSSPGKGGAMPNRAAIESPGKGAAASKMSAKKPPLSAAASISAPVPAPASVAEVAVPNPAAASTPASSPVKPSWAAIAKMGSVKGVSAGVVINKKPRSLPSASIPPASVVVAAAAPAPDPVVSAKVLVPAAEIVGAKQVVELEPVVASVVPASATVVAAKATEPEPVVVAVPAAITPGCVPILIIPAEAKPFASTLVDMAVKVDTAVLTEGYVSAAAFVDKLAAPEAEVPALTLVPAIATKSKITLAVDLTAEITIESVPAQVSAAIATISEANAKLAVVPASIPVHVEETATVAAKPAVSATVVEDLPPPMMPGYCYPLYGMHPGYGVMYYPQPQEEIDPRIAPGVFVPAQDGKSLVEVMPQFPGYLPPFQPYGYDPAFTYCLPYAMQPAYGVVPSYPLQVPLNPPLLGAPTPSSPYHEAGYAPAVSGQGSFVKMLGVDDRPRGSHTERERQRKINKKQSQMAAARPPEIGGFVAREMDAAARATGEPSHHSP